MSQFSASPLTPSDETQPNGAFQKEPAGGMQANLAMVGLWALCLFAVFSPGAPLQFSHGILYLLAGCLMIALPPRIGVARPLLVLSIVFLGLCSLCFLPVAWSGALPWRTGLQQAGLDLGNQITAHPRLSLEELTGDAIGLLVCLYILSQRVSEKAAAGLALLFTLGVAAYALAAILMGTANGGLAWHPEATFGFFPNRNHTATLLSMGVISGIATLFYGVKSQRAGLSGPAAMAVVICLWASAGYNISRAGLVLTVAGLMGWLLCVGRNLISRRALAVILAFIAIAGALFWISDTGLKARFAVPDAASPELQSGLNPPPRTSTVNGEEFDFRLLIYRDTLPMTVGSPWTGFGRGMFAPVFPQYRWFSSSRNGSQSVHPESDWLMVAAESGWPAMVVLAAGVGWLLLGIFRTVGNSSLRSLRLGCLIAAAVVPFHGLFDVPGHRVGLVWSAVFLLVLANRDKGAMPASHWGRWVWRMVGTVVLLAGAQLLRSEATGTHTLAIVRAERLREEALKLFRQDQEDQRKIASGKMAEHSAESPDQVEKALVLIDEALALTPMDAELYYLKGSMALLFTEKEDITDKSYLINRLLDPSWVRLPVRQAANLAGVLPLRVPELWTEAMKRAEKLESLAPMAFNRQLVFREIMDQAGKNEQLSLLAADQIGDAPVNMQLWTSRAHLAALRSSLPVFLSGRFVQQRDALLQIWVKRDKVSAGEWSTANP